MKLYLNLLLIFSIFHISCTTVEHTNRKSLSIVSEDVLIQKSKKSFNKLKENSKLSTNTLYYKMTDNVLNNITNVLSTEENINLNFDYIILEDKIKNAFVMPGGYIGIYSGLFDIIDDESELAVVISHEIAHIVAKHSVERASQSLIKSGVGILLGLFSNSKSLNNQSDLIRAYRYGSTYGFILPYSRLHEKEADYLGLLYMAKSGYNPRAAISFWKKMQKQSRTNLPEIFSTHPSNDSRIDYLESIIDEILPIYYNAIN